MFKSIRLIDISMQIKKLQLKVYQEKEFIRSPHSLMVINIWLPFNFQVRLSLTFGDCPRGVTCED